MIGERYWSTGLTVKARLESGGKLSWAVSCRYLDNGFANDNADSAAISTEGTLHTRYYVRDGETADGLTVAIDAVIRDAITLGIVWSEETGPSLYYEGDGENPDYPPPGNWREILTAQAKRLGWDGVW